MKGLKDPGGTPSSERPLGITQSSTPPFAGVACKEIEYENPLVTIWLSQGLYEASNLSILFHNCRSCREPSSKKFVFIIDHFFYVVMQEI
mgnify:CR=1 FL=1